METLKRIYNNTLLRGTIWLVIRLWVGYEFLTAGWEKITGDGSAVWVGPKAGTAITGFLNGAVAKSTGDHPAVLGWFADLTKNVFLPNAGILTYMVAYGEVLVGAALILGLFTRFAAFWGAFLNLMFMLAGSTGVNPPMFTLEVFILLVGGTAGLVGLDYFAMPILRSVTKRVFGRKVEQPVVAEAPVFLPIDKARYIASEHAVETPDQTAQR
jgi:thiosulfate dehydrogenase [quinone] large subunit